MPLCESLRASDYEFLADILVHEDLTQKKVWDDYGFSGLFPHLHRGLHDYL